MTGTYRPEKLSIFIRERCDHENDLDQLKNGVKAMTWPVHDLVSNWAYLVIAALDWNLKAWLGLLTPRTSLRHQILRMEFKRFIHTFILILCLIIKTGRRIVYLSVQIWENVNFKYLGHLLTKTRLFWV
jgi:hypothetical protein